MKAAVILSLVSLAFGSVVEKRACAANNCNRAVTGTRAGLPALSSRSADCSSFQLATVTPAATTTTVTVTVTEAPAKLKRAAAALDIRQATVLPTFVPAYASACANSAAYASACDCFGITATTTTVPTPTSTVTVTTTIDYCEDL